MNFQSMSAEAIAKERIEQVRNSIPNTDGKTGITQAEMATRLNISQSKYSKTVNGSASISTDILVGVAKLGNVSVDWLLGLTEDRQKVFSTLDSIGLSEESGNTLAHLLSLENEHDESFGLNYLNEIITHPQFIPFLQALINLESAYQTPHFSSHYDKETLSEAEIIASDSIKKLFPNLDIIIACDRKTITELRTKEAVDLASKIIEDVCSKDAWEQYCGHR